jgi:Glycosyl hydrolase family 26
MGTGMPSFSSHRQVCRRALLLILPLLCVLSVSPAHAALGPDSKRVCVYSAHKISELVEFSEMVGRPMDCALVFTAPVTWDHWEHPWFLAHKDPNYNWKNWAVAPGTNRELIITQALIPQVAETDDWRHLGASGAYDDHARHLAENLVAAGLGDTVIRLNHEMNGDWYPSSIGTTAADFDLWVKFWRHTVIAMRSVPGAHFQFDWCINGRYRPIPLSDFYPGDAYVDIVGIDPYDGGVPEGEPRWATIYGKADGIRDIEEFAAAHSKPMSIPEWGVAPADFQLSGGDDKEYVDGIAHVVQTNHVAFQSYFYNHEWAWQLANGPLSLAAYIRHFGINGDAAPVDAASTTSGDAAEGKAPRLRILWGPKRGKRRGTARFSFRAQKGAQLACRLDKRPWRGCSQHSRDVLTRLHRGRHKWRVAARDTTGRTTIRKRSFTCKWVSHRHVASLRCRR